MAQQTPEKQVLPIAPNYPDLVALTRWAGDLTRTLQQNLATIARKANDADTVPLTGNLNASGFDITNIGNLGNISGTITYKGADIDARYVNVTGDTMTGSLTLSTGAVQAAIITGNTAGSGSFVTGVSGNTNIYVDNAHTLFFRTASQTSIQTGAFTSATDLMTLSAAGVLTMSLGELVTLAPTTATAGLRLPHGTAPTSPVNGDVWTTTTGMFFQQNGALRTIARLEATQTWSGTQNFNTVSIGAANNANNVIEFGYQGGTGTLTVIDFHTGATAVDYDTRILTSGGTGVTGGGTFALVGGNFTATFSNFTVSSGGAVSAGAYQIAGVSIPFTKAYESAQQTITSAGSLTLAHGLGVKPKLYMAVIQCTTAEQGYSIGHELPVFVSASVTQNEVIGLVPDATNMNVRFGASTSAFQAVHFTTGVHAALTNANWRLVVRAWA